MSLESATPQPKVEFALGSEVSPCHFFKSSFARSLVRNARDAKSLDYELLDNGTIIEETAECNADGRNNNFFSLLEFRSEKTTTTMTSTSTNSSTRCEGNTDNALWNGSAPVETNQSAVDANELERLRKQCQTLKDENRRLQNALTLNQVPHVQVIDNVFLQTQIDTLQWQLKQIDANRQMYRSLMEQVARFLDRAHKSLDILHEKNNPKDKSGARVPRSRSVHAVHAVHGDCSPSRGTLTSSSSSSNGSSRFTRAKSVNQISAGTGFREFTWSVLRRNDPVHCTPPREKSHQDNMNKTHEGVLYRRPKQMELDPDDVPPEKLSQEAFRLMRTVQSLLAMREPDLARMSPVDDGAASPSPVSNHHHHHHHHSHHETSLTLPNDSFVNSNSLQEENYGRCSGVSDRGNESSGTEMDNTRVVSSCYLKSSSNSNEVNRNLQNLLPGVRRSLDATSLNSGSSKTTEEEDPIAVSNRENGGSHIAPRELVTSFATGTSTSTPNKRTKRIEKKPNGDVVLMARSTRSKVATSVSSAEDESGFSSMSSSFQEVGLPPTLPISPIKGCHTEVGLPEIPLEKVAHRRWSSTPAEIQALLKRHSASFSTSQTNTESLSVWV
ncbi:hypothetical protein KPH14_011463 [Odynerus spinipes]|uniref:Uncharacterized protein n=1 Tax=Odynerus spinipes TaxID=1348599 RepID=A0AAD9RVT5_9HYME|nr:hypothetical protein KPH14_011463 [Odynerus spinipes]